MLPRAELKRFAAQAAAMLARDRDLAAFEVYASSTEQIVARINCTGEIVSRGVEEVKSLAADGFALRIVTRRDPHETGSAFVAGDLSTASVKQALAQALDALVVDPDFPGLPPGSGGIAAGGGQKPGLIGVSHLVVARAAWTTLKGAVAEFARRAPPHLRNPGLIIGGDFTLTRERIAIGSSRRADIGCDQDAYFSASVTVIIEETQAKATASAIGRSSEELRRAQTSLGRDAMRRALDSRPPVRPGSGRYRVLIGPQPLGEILSYMVVPSLTSGAFYRGDSAYQGRFGSSVMDPRISLIEDATAPHGAIQRSMTCEGLPARRTLLIRDGRLSGLLSNFYDRNRLLSDDARLRKLGASAPAALDIAAGNGYRIGEHGARSFDTAIHSSASNIIIKTKDGASLAQLIRQVGNGIMIGRVWYTYPINGQRAGDFTCTVSGDSYLIEDGRISAPIAPNCLRINAHIDQVFAAPAALTARSTPTFVWGQPEAFYLPALMVDGLPLASASQ